MKILIAYGSKGKFHHLKDFVDELEKQNILAKLVKDTDYSRGFPSKNISDWIGGDKKFKKLILNFKPDAIFVDRQAHFALHAIKSGIPTFVLLRGHYWQEYFWAMKTLGANIKNRIVIWLRNRTAERVFRDATMIFPICGYLDDVVKRKYPGKNTGVFLEGIDSQQWFHEEKMNLKHPSVGMVQDANWWGKTKELLVLERVLDRLPNVNFYWVGDGQYRNEITSRLEKFENFKWLGRLDYPEGIRKFLESIDVYALITGMDLAPLTLKEAQVMEKPVLATDVGGDKEMMVDGETGFLVREGSAEDIILRITELLDNKETAKEMGIKGARFVKKKFNWEVVTKEFLKNIQPYVNSK